MSYVGNNPVFGSVAIRRVTLATAGAINNLDPASGSLIRLTAATSVTGVVAGSSGREVTFINGSGSNITFAHQSASSSAANRFYIPEAADVIVPDKGSITFMYDDIGTQWVMKGRGTKAATIDTAQTLTNKTLTAPVISSISNTGTLTLPTSTDTLVGRATTDTLTNKSLTAAVVTNYEDFTEVSAPSAPSSGTLRIYAKTDDKIYKKDSTGVETELGAGGSSGRNYLQDWFDGTRAIGTVTSGLTDTGNRTVSTTAWAAKQITDLTVSNNTTTPLRQTGDILVDSVTSTSGAFVETPMFLLDSADLGKAVSLQFDITGVATSGNFDVVVIRYNTSGTYQETISVGGSASAGTPASALLPTGTTKFPGFFIAGSTSTDYYAVRIRKLLAVNDDFQIDSLFTGPGSIATGTAITDWQSYTPTFLGLGTVTNTDVKYRRTGDSIEVQGFTETGTPTGVAVSISLPSGLIVDNTKVSTVNKHVFGVGHVAAGGAPAGAFVNSVGVAVIYDPANTGVVNIGASVATAAGTTTINAANLGTDLFVASSQFSFRFTIPVATWSSNVTMADRAVEEYAYNSSTATAADDTTSFANGSQGAKIQNITAALTRRVRFNTPILPTDRLIFEVSTDRIRWAELSQTGQWGSGTISPRTLQGSVQYGAGIYNFVTATNTDVDIRFGTYSTTTNAAYAGAGEAWSAGPAGDAYWRIKKVTGGAVVGYPINDQNIIRTRENVSTTGNIDNLTVGSNVTVIKFTGASPVLRGLASLRVDGQIVTLISATSGSLVINNQDANSTDVNRIITGTGAAITITTDGAATMIYDADTARWRVLSVNA